MSNDEGLQEFLSRSRILPEDFSSANITWETLCEIRDDYNCQHAALVSTSQFFASSLQQHAKVHSVRWRVKSTDHLLAKIIRKRCQSLDDSTNPYHKIDSTNYFEIIGDLVGIRALHLFKNECFEIGNFIENTFVLTDKPIAYVRLGDPDELTSRLKDEGFDVQNHPLGYRSAHYVVASQPAKRKTLVEIQVRTIFEEGWSEVDHQVRYPGLVNDRLVDYFLAIFNRTAGSADEMGEFVQDLTQARLMHTIEMENRKKERDELFAALENALADVQAKDLHNNVTKNQLDTVNSELSILRSKIEKYESLNREFLAGWPSDSTSFRRTLASIGPSVSPSMLIRGRTVADMLRQEAPHITPTNNEK